MTESKNAAGPTDQSIDQLAVDTIRTLSMDAVQAANSGHPGTPMALAPVAYTLWQQFLRFDPELPIWANRDRFVLSAGHASTLLYSLLHLTGVKAVNPDYETLGEPAVSLDDLKRFRQLDSKCPGHPEYRWTSGVECTTGPLGTGIATSVGMAIAGRWQAATFNRPGFDAVRLRRLRPGRRRLPDGGHRRGGGLARRAPAAGQPVLDLRQQPDHHRGQHEPGVQRGRRRPGSSATAGTCTHVGDANDLDALAAAFDAFRAETARPTLIIVDSLIGYGAPHKQGTHAAHGEPLGDDEVRAAKRFYGWPEDAPFLVPDEVYAHFARRHAATAAASCGASGRRCSPRYAEQYPDLADQLNRMQQRTLPDDWDADIPDVPRRREGPGRP